MFTHHTTASLCAIETYVLNSNRNKSLKNTMSWDRSRAIPWSKICQDPGVDQDAYKERVFREIQQEEALQVQSQQLAVKGEEEDAQAKTGVPQGIPFSGMEMAKQAAFGGCIGRSISLFAISVCRRNLV